MSDQLVLGVDSSTSATKVIAFDSAGKVVAEGAQGYPLFNEHPGWVEQLPDDWWEAFKVGCRQVGSQPDVQAKKMIGIGFTHQRFTFVPVDSDLRPLRKAILWNDIRCSQEADHASATIGKQKIFERTGYPPGQWTLYKLLWLKNHEPDVYARTYKLMLVQDYLIYKLTGNVVTLAGAATMTGALDIANPKRWATDIIQGLGLREDVWIDRILPGATVAGYVTRKAAAETGLPEGLPVVTGAGDQPCGILGAGVTQPGQLGINGGTSCTNELVAKGLPERKELNYVIEISPTGDYIVENYIPSGGSAVMNWYKSNFGAYEVEKAKRDGVSVWDVVYGQAAEAPVGNRGMMAIPYLNGANGPYWDLNARGVIFGVHADYGRAHMIRALLEGCAYESRRQAELMEQGTSTKVEEIRMYGGSARSDIWNQMFADVLDKPLCVPETAETTALGAAISAAVACGMHDGFRQCVDRMVSVRKTYRPNPRSATTYEELYQRVYRRFYDSVRGLMRETAAINERIDAAAQAEDHAPARDDGRSVTSQPRP
jgi:sugar (pentulose or hexulose) kinase